MILLRYNTNLEKDSPKIGALLSNSSILNISDLYYRKTGSNLSSLDLILSYLDDKNFINFIRSPDSNFIVDKSKVNILCPLNKINSLRDAYSFRQHVETSRKNRGLKMIEEFDNFPIYYYSNHNSVTGPGSIEIDKTFSEKLDYELEIAIIIGK